MDQFSRADNPIPVSRSVSMSVKEFRLFSTFIENACGIRMPDSKKNMLESRLQKRLRSLGISSFRAYYDFLVSPQGKRDELVSMIDVVTTNKTDFFREPAHFDFLTEQVLPEMISKGFGQRMRLWSAGCSSGEEPYTLAMVISEYDRKIQPCNFSVLATDICTTVLDKAKLGVYEEEKIVPVPYDMRKQYLLRCRDRERGVVRIAPEIRALVTFRRLNFLDENYRIAEPMQIIFCRNVLIYFDRATQEMMINRLCLNLMPGGYLFLGHSETINGMNLPLRQVNSTIYRKSA